MFDLKHIDFDAQSYDKELCRRPLHELRELWPVACLRAARGKTGAVLLSIVAHNFPDALDRVLRAAFGAEYRMAPPFYCSAARIVAGGFVVADVMDRGGVKRHNAYCFLNKDQLQGHFRRFADELKLEDADRLALFKAVQNWVVADFRRDPQNPERTLPAMA